MAKIVTATWTDPSPTTYVDHLEVWRKTGSSGTYAKISGNITLGTETYIDNSALTDGETYYYNVRAYNSSGGFNSIEANITISEKYILDTYPNAKIAYSLRQLKTGVTNVIRVKRSSDDAEQDFTPSEILDGTLTTWVGAGNDGAVITWYDQSGNGQDAKGSSSSIETNLNPLIVSSGSLVTTNSKPAVDFTSTQGYRLTTDLKVISQDLWSIYSVVDITSLTGVQNIISQHDGTATNGRTVFLYMQSTNLSGRAYINDAGTGHDINGTVNHTVKQGLFENYADGSGNYKLGDNGNTLEIGLSATPYTPLDASLNLGGIGSSASGASFEGKLQEVIIYESNQETNRTGIIGDINTEYSIY